MSTSFWLQFGAQVATIALQVGEEVGLAFLQGFLNQHFGAGNAPIVFTPPAPVLANPTQK